MKIKVGVFFGGRSVEHEVSIISAIQAIASFDTNKYDVIPVYITKDNSMYVGEYIGIIEEYQNLKALLEKSQKVILINEDNKLNLVKYPMKKFGNNVYDYIDVAFPIVHGTNVEDGALQGYFKTMNIPFVGCDVLASAVGMDKYVMKTVLKDNGIPVLDCMLSDIKSYNANPEAVCGEIENTVGYPLIIKPINLGSSIGIKTADSREALTEAIEYAFQFANKVLIERLVVNLKEVNCSVLGDTEEAEASECEEPVSTGKILDFNDKYINGDKSESGMSSLKRKLPADITAEMRDKIRQLAVQTFQLLGCNGVSRIDFMIDTKTNNVWVNEINTIPGSLSFYLWEPVGVKYLELLDRMIKLALKRDRENKDISYTFDTNILSGVKLGGLKGGKLGSKL